MYINGSFFNVLLVYFGGSEFKYTRVKVKQQQAKARKFSNKRFYRIYIETENFKCECLYHTFLFLCLGVQMAKCCIAILSVLLLYFQNELVRHCQ